MYPSLLDNMQNPHFFQHRTLLHTQMTLLSLIPSDNVSKFSNLSLLQRQDNLKHVEIYFHKLVFAREQLYAPISRVTFQSGMKLLVCDKCDEYYLKCSLQRGFPKIKLIRQVMEYVKDIQICF
ncbi:hypothetical protein CR513_62337, partial [Mucuna pruriens]